MIAAPMATASSGWTFSEGGLPMNSPTACWTSGIRDWPPTSSISSTWSLPVPASLRMRSHRLDRAFDEVPGELFELLARDLDVDVERTLAVVVLGDLGEVDARLLDRGELDLGGLGRVADAVDRERS
jgi:hypothetical protein